MSHASQHHVICMLLARSHVLYTNFVFLHIAIDSILLWISRAWWGSMLYWLLLHKSNDIIILNHKIRRYRAMLQSVLCWGV
jgi:hypothetical protein